MGVQEPKSGLQKTQRQGFISLSQMPKWLVASSPQENPLAEVTLHLGTYEVSHIKETLRITLPSIANPRSRKTN